MTTSAATPVHPLIRMRSAYRKTGRLALVRSAALAAFACNVGAKGQKSEAVSQRGDQPVEWTISLTDDVELHRLNLQFRGMDKPTDVLSFSSERYRDGKLKPDANAAPGSADAPEFLGDIVISMERCSEQAAAAGHPIESELALLVIHGTLHLLGYDHNSKTRKARMWSTQSRALQSIGITLDVA